MKAVLLLCVLLLSACAVPNGIAQNPYIVCRVSDGAAIVVFQSSQALVGSAGVGAVLSDVKNCAALMPAPAASAPIVMTVTPLAVTK